MLPSLRVVRHVSTAMLLFSCCCGAARTKAALMLLAEILLVITKPFSHASSPPTPCAKLLLPPVSLCAKLLPKRIPIRTQAKQPRPPACASL